MLGFSFGVGRKAMMGGAVPTFIGYVTATSTPTIPAHQVGDLIVGAQLRTGDTAPVPDAAEGWNRWETVAFATGTAAYVAGQTLTQGGVTATIHRVHLTSGTWGGGNAAGFLTIRNRSGGSFTSGVATTASGSATLSAAEIGSYGGGGASMTMGWKIADSTGELWGNWVQAGRRMAWVFRNADIGVWAGAIAASSTNLAYPALTGMSAPGIVGVAGYCVTAQTSLASKDPDGFTNRTANAAGGIVVSDSGATFLNSFAGDTKTIDTASVTAALSFSVRAAA